MKATHHNEPRARRLVRSLIALSLTLCVLRAAPAFALDSGDIVIANARGEVRLVTGGVTHAPRDGALLEPPATLRTGHDGSVDLRQGATTVSVGPDTVLEFPALAERGAPIDRIVQPSGSAFYDIGKRAGRKLRVETPYLVGVVKGTQFNVVAQDQAATISLYEGLLEIRAADDSSSVDIGAGEVASRKQGDRAIGVMRMNEPTPRPARPGPAPAVGGSPPVPGIEGDALMAGEHAADQPLVSGMIDTFVQVRPVVPRGTEVQESPGVPPVITHVVVDSPAAGAAVPPLAGEPAVADSPVGVNPGPVVADLPGSGVDAPVTVGGADLHIDGGNSGESGDQSGHGDTGGGSGNGNGNGNAGSNSSGNGNGNSGNGDNSNHGREDDGVHGLAHKK
jgi:hypothetical protein